MPAVVEGIDVEPVSRWLERHVAGAAAPFTFERIGGGRSNLTFAVTGGCRRRASSSAAHRCTTSSPPLTTWPASTGRSRRSGRRRVPVPAALGLCTDEAVNGAPFYVMSLVEGAVVDSVAQRGAARAAARATMATQLADVLAELHGLDVDAIGLGDFARREGYIDRQIARWSKQWERSKTRELPAVDDVAKQLADRVPAAAGRRRGPRRLPLRQLHRRSRRSGEIAAVLDWELCTLGDPLADVGYVGAHWAPTRGWRRPPQRPDGCRRVRHATTTSSSATPAQLLVTSPTIDFYVAFQLWRTAIILEGVYARYLGGAYGGQQLGAELDVLRDSPVELDRAAAQAQRSTALGRDRWPTVNRRRELRRRRHRFGPERARRRRSRSPARGRRVLVVEGQATPAAGTRSAELTEPGFVHDVCSAIHPLGSRLAGAADDAARSPRAALDPAAPYRSPIRSTTTPSCWSDRSRRPAPASASTARRGAELFAPVVDGGIRLRRRRAVAVLAARPPDRDGPLRARTPCARRRRSLRRRTSTGDEPPALFAGVAAHAVLPFDRPVTAGVGLFLGALGHLAGWPLPAAGSQAIADALVAELRSHGGEIECGRPIGGLDELPSSAVVLADVVPRNLVRHRR